MRPEAALGAAPEVVGEPDRGDGCDGRRAERDQRPDERQPQATEVPALRAAGENQVDELAAPVHEAREVAHRRTMLELERNLPNVEPGPERVDRHPRLDPEARRHREDLGAGGGRQEALAGERFAHAPSASTLDQRACDPLRDPDAAAYPAGECGDRDVAAGIDQGTEVAAEVGVAEEERAVTARPLGERQCLALPAPRQADDPGARLPCAIGGRVVGTVVGNDDVRIREGITQGHDGRGDHVLLVACGDEHRERHAHSSVGVGTGGASGRTPSTASGPIP